VYSLVFLFLCSFALAFLLTPWLREVARRQGWVDRPDGARKRHGQAIPRLGGVAVIAAFLLSFALWWASPLQGVVLVQSNLAPIVQLLPALAVVFAVGVWDDFRGLSARQKLIGQVGAAIWAYASGVRIPVAESLTPELGWLSLPVTILWLVGCANAVNLIDGLDGLAAGVAVVALSAVSVSALVQGNDALAFAAVPLAGALFGFLRYNFNPASIFLGDGGSLTIGFLLGCYSALWSQKVVTVLGLAAPAMVLAVPLLDTGIAIVRRYVLGQPIFGADRRHIHHMLLDRGFSPRQAVWWLYGAGAVGAVLAVWVNRSQYNWEAAGAAAVAVALLAGGVRALGYREFEAVGRMLRQGLWRRAVRQELDRQEAWQLVTSAQGPEEYWSALAGIARRYGFGGLRIEQHGRHREIEWGEGWTAEWSLVLTLPRRMSVQLWRPGPGGPWAPLGEFLDFLREQAPAMERMLAPEAGEAQRPAENGWEPGELADEEREASLASTARAARS
jgi:UDP-GlcNAc:undecaprenyl-phosphate GlcNAc-1-phosphate transferase